MKLLGLLLLVGACSYAQQNLPGRRLALVIGNDAYRQGNQLKNAVNDARAMRDALRESGFAVELIENATRESLETAVEQFIGKLQRGDVALFYYSGHAVQIRGENYLVPVNIDATTEVQMRTRSLSATEVLEQMESARTDLQIMILDACRNNPFGRGRGSSLGLAPMNTGKGTLVAYATAPGQTADDNISGSNGMYTMQLLAAIRKPGLKLEEVFKVAGEGVQQVSRGRQIPWTSSSVAGEFYFQLPPAEPGRPMTTRKQEPSPGITLPAATIELRYGSLTVSSDHGGTLLVDGQRFGELQPFAVMQFPRLPAGSHIVRVEKFGFEPAEQQVAVLPDQRATVDLRLTAATGQATSAALPAAPNVLSRVNGNDGQRYVWIPAGTFQMGCSPRDTECDDDETPTHTVTISRGFWIGQTEVTVGAFQTFARATGFQVRGSPSGERHPVLNVTWNEAKSYCEWIGGWLPTEAQWEYAVRGGSAAARYGSLDAIAWYSGNSGGRTSEVARKQPNGYGLFDMMGSLWEWVEDWYGPYTRDVVSDPSGPATGSFEAGPGT